MKFVNSFKKAVFLVAILNLIFFFIEFTVALNIRSVSLLADSIDFIEDTSINFLIFFAVSLSLVKRAKISIFLSIIMMLPGFVAIWAVWKQIIYQQPPEPIELSIVGFGALVVNCFCTYILIKFKNYSGSLTKAAFLSARNDAIANITIIIAGIITIFHPSIWPDILVGLFIAYIRTESALEIYKKASNELKNIQESSKKN